MDYFKQMDKTKRLLKWLSKKADENYRKIRSSITAIIKSIRKDEKEKQKEYSEERKGIENTRFEEDEETGRIRATTPEEQKERLASLDKEAGAKERQAEETIAQLKRDSLDPENSLRDLSALQATVPLNPEMNKNITDATVAEQGNKEIDTTAREIATRQKIAFDRTRAVTNELDTIEAQRAKEQKKDDEKEKDEENRRLGRKPTEKLGEPKPKEKAPILQPVMVEEKE